MKAQTDNGLRELVERYSPETIFTKILMDKLGIQHYYSSFDEQHRFQSLVYILESQKIMKIYNFGFCLKGPHSSELYNLGYDACLIKDSTIEKLKLDSRTEKRIEDVLEKLGDLKDNYQWLERAAFILFAKNNGYTVNALYNGRLKRLNRNLVKTTAKSLKKLQLT